ncbi:MFS transporter [Acidisoma sp. C75]
MATTPAADIAARLNRLPATRTIWGLVILASLGGVFEFYDLFFTGYVAPGLIKSGLFKPASLGFFASLHVIAVSGFGTFVFSTFAGLWFGVIIFARAVDRFGRKPVFLASLIWYGICTAIMAFQSSGEAVNIWRFIASFGFGVQLVTIDTYISEIMPPRGRGRAFSINQFITFCAVPIVALLAWLLVPLHPLGLAGWRWVVLIGAAGALAIVLPIARLPESPRWLGMTGRLDEAERITAMLERRVTADLGRPLPAPLPVTEEAHQRGRFREIFSPAYLKRTIVLSVFNAAQVIGFYGFAAWVPSLLIARGITLTHSLEYSFIIAIANPIGPLIGALFADKLERRTQIVLGLIVMGIAMALFAIASNPAVLILLGVAFTLAANIMSFAYHGYQAELYPTRIRGQAVGFVYSWSRLAAAFAGLVIGVLLHRYGVPGVAIFIGAAMVVGIVSIGVFGPPTLGRALEEINH